MNFLSYNYLCLHALYNTRHGTSVCHHHANHLSMIDIVVVGNLGWTTVGDGG